MNNHEFSYVTAAYRKEVIGRYAGNPYIEALPALPEDLELAKALRYLPAFDPAERLLPPAERIQRLDLLGQLVVPLPRLVRLARAILKMLRTGYGPRSPGSKTDHAIQTAMYEQQQMGSFVSASRSDRAAQHTLALIGASGCGKSYGLRNVAALLPSVIHHPEHGLWQVPFLFVEMPYDGESLHTLASALFEEIDRVVPDAGYTELYMERKGLNAQQRLAMALKCAYRHGVGMVFVDETQNQRGQEDLRQRRTRKSASANAPKLEIPLTKLLVSASNTSHMPICFSGTLELNAMLGTRFSKARRSAGRGSSLWLPLESSGNLKAPQEFELMLMALWRYQWLQGPAELSDAWVKLFFELTQGITDIIVKLFESAQEAAIANKSETLTEDLVRSVFRAEFFATEFGIVALRDKTTALPMVSDLYLPDSVELAREESKEQFTAPNREKPAKRPAGALLRAAEVTKKALAKAADGAKDTKAGPTPVEVSAEVARGADLRGTTFGPNDDAAGAETAAAATEPFAG